MKLTILCLHGPMGCGKSEVASIVRSISDACVIIIPFAGPLKQAALTLGWNGKKDKKGRKLLQLLGTEVGRNCIDHNIWTKKWTDYITQLIHDHKPVVDHLILVCDDLRFYNEYVAGRENAAKIIKITGRNYGGWLKRFRMKFLPWTLHKSERPLKVPFDYTIDNSGSKEYLLAQVSTILTEAGVSVRHG